MPKNIVDIIDLYDKSQGVHDRDLALDDGALDFLKFVFSNPSPTIDFSDDFISSVKDVDESMLTFEQL